MQKKHCFSTQKGLDCLVDVIHRWGKHLRLQNVFKFEIYLWQTFCYINTDPEILLQFVMSLKDLLQVTFRLPALPSIPLRARHAQLMLACMPNHIPVSSCPQKTESNHCCGVDGIPVKMRTSESRRIYCLATSNPILSHFFVLWQAINWE